MNPGDRKRTARAGKTGSAARGAAGGGRKVVTAKGGARGGPAKKGKKIIRTHTGIVRLDELLRGGIKVPSQVAVLGATHIGKETLMYEFIAEGLRKNVPAIVVLTKNNTTDFRKGLKKVFPGLQGYEKKGYMRYVDMYSLTVGMKGKNPYANYINGVDKMDDLFKVISALGKIYAGKAPYHRVVLHDLSMFHSKLGYNRAQDLINSMTARSDSYKSITLFDIVDGVHPEGEVRALEDGLDGTIELRSKADTHHLRIKGLGDPLTHDWVEYRYSDAKFEVTGPFAMTRIH
jgi:KaiC/GvpD/RAD55 family RecA-like ATPase